MIQKDGRMAMKKCWLGIGILFFSAAVLSCQGRRESFPVAFYNVENFFDTILSSDRDDGEFTCCAPRWWCSSRYERKRENIARVISDLDRAAGGLALLGLCEVESREVVRDLLERASLSDFQVVFRRSADPRGIEVALAYDPDLYRPLSEEFIKVSFPSRDILHSRGVTRRGDTLDVFVNHWTSRRAGQKASEKYRLEYSRRLARSVDSLRRERPGAKIVVMGDFNDTPRDKSIEEFSLRFPDIPNRSHLPSYYYRGEGLVFDMIFSNLGDAGFSASVFSPSYLLGESGLPLRTFQGPVYRGGFSDHLPVYIAF